MKTIFISIIIVLIASSQIKLLGQCSAYLLDSIYTPNNTKVYYSEWQYCATDISSADNIAMCEAAEDYFYDEHYGIFCLMDATRAYNCHGYTWGSTEGEDYDLWLLLEQSEKFWTDGSYVLVGLESNATKVVLEENIKSSTHVVWNETTQEFEEETVYKDWGDHSGVTTDTSEYIISKWGQMPLFRHHIDDMIYIPPAGGELYFKKCEEEIDYNITSDLTISECCQITLSNVSISTGVDVSLNVGSYDDYITVSEYLKIEGTFDAPVGSTLDITAN